MLVTTKWIENHYNEFNDLYFEGALPRIAFKVNRSKRIWGFAAYKFDFKNNTLIPESITISNYYDSPEKVKIQTLLHEMIHIYDYFWHPEHFIRNHKPLPRRHYNAHGSWFKKEAERISRESGYDVTTHVSKEEMNVSDLSEKSKKLNKAKENKALICALFGTRNIWWFKTEINNVTYIKRYIKRQYNWENIIGEIKHIKFYSFNNPELAIKRSCRKRIRGWQTDKFGFMNKMKEFKATEVKL